MKETEYILCPAIRRRIPRPCQPYRDGENELYLNETPRNKNHHNNQN